MSTIACHTLCHAKTERPFQFPSHSKENNPNMIKTHQTSPMHRLLLRQRPLQRQHHLRPRLLPGQFLQREHHHPRSPKHHLYWLQIRQWSSHNGNTHGSLGRRYAGAQMQACVESNGKAGWSLCYMQYWFQTRRICQCGCVLLLERGSGSCIGVFVPPF